MSNRKKALVAIMLNGVALLILISAGLYIKLLNHKAEKPAEKPMADIILIGDSHIKDLEVRTLNYTSENCGYRLATVQSITPVVERVAGRNPKIVLIHVGINNFLLMPDGLPEQYVEMLKYFSPKTKIIASAMFPPTNYFCEEMRVKNGSWVAGLNSKIVAMTADMPNVTWIDAGKSMTDQDGFLDPEYTYDGLHLNGEGQLIWAKHINKAIQETLRSIP